MWMSVRRVGVKPGRPVVELASLVHNTSGLKLEGLMAWEGHTQTIIDPVEKNDAIRHAIGILVENAEMCRTAGLPMNIVSCGGTSTYRFTCKCQGVTEIQAGGGILGDIRYRNEGVDSTRRCFSKRW